MVAPVRAQQTDALIVLVGDDTPAVDLLRNATVRRIGPAGLEQLTAGPLEIEDILYVIAAVTWLGWLQPFLLATAVGASLFACYCAARLARAAGLLPRYASSRPR